MLFAKFLTPYNVCVQVWEVGGGRDDRSAISADTRRRSAVLGSRSYTARTEVSHS